MESRPISPNRKRGRTTRYRSISVADASGWYWNAILPVIQYNPAIVA